MLLHSFGINTKRITPHLRGDLLFLAQHDAKKCAEWRKADLREWAAGAVATVHAFIRFARCAQRINEDLLPAHVHSFTSSAFLSLG